LCGAFSGYNVRDTLTGTRLLEAVVARYWKANPAALLERRIGKSAKELGQTDGKDTCPDIWRLDNGDVAIIGTDLTGAYADRLPGDVNLAPYERLVVIPGTLFNAAREDGTDA
jgi:hypothetical protein